MGKCSWENLLANPAPMDTTLVIGTDDSTPGQVYLYIGTKTASGNDVERAGLANGLLYGIRANASAADSRDENVALTGSQSLGMSKGGSASFGLVPLGNAASLTGAQVQTASVAGGITEFLRPEDGAWDPANPRDFYFATTDGFDTTKNGGSGAAALVTTSRLYRLRFTDLNDPTAGGSITMLLDGSENHQMLDNITVDRYGRVLCQEDTGNVDHTAKIWAYTISTGAWNEIASHDPALFGSRIGGVTTAAQTGFTKDEESSGIIDVSDILGAGKYLAVVQAHSTTKYTNGTDIPDLPQHIEGGQLLVMTNSAPPLAVGNLNVRNWGFGALRAGSTILNQDALLTSDGLTASSGITYTLTTAPVTGNIIKGGAATSTFTQADIAAGLVSYVHTNGGNGGSDAFDKIIFSVTNGTSTISAQELNISVGSGLRVQKIGQYSVPAGYDSAGGVAEIIAFDATSKRLFLVNGKSNTVDVLGTQGTQIGSPVLISALNPSAVVSTATNVTSVACKNGLLAVAVGNTVKTTPGYVFFYTAATGAYLSHLDFGSLFPGGTKGALPDMVTFTPDGSKVLLAIEGEPSDDSAYTDPEGGVVVVDLVAGVPAATATFIGFDDAQTAAYKTAGVRIFNDKATTAPAASAAKDLEPEYIAVSADSSTAFVSLQENNALAVINLATKTVTSVTAFGSKDYSLAGNELDLSDEDGGANTDAGSASIKLANFPLRGLYMPDGMASFSSGGNTLLVTANEGDARDWNRLKEEARLRSATKDAQWLIDNPNQSFDSNMGRINLTKFSGDTDGDGDIDVMHAYGSRSFSIWNANGTQQFDSGSAFETFFSIYFPTYFNSNHNGATNGFDTRSDDKGPEPEGAAIVTVGAKNYAAIGLERMGGFFLYDVTVPTAPTLASYYTGRIFTAAPNGPAAGDLGVEGLLSISATDSPTGTALIVLGNEVSGTVSIHSVVPATVGINLPPTISSLSNVTVPVSGSTSPRSFIIGDADTALSNLVVSVSSSNPAYLPSGNVVLGGSGTSRTVNCTPVLATSGSSEVTITVGDGIANAVSSFTVSSVNTAPTISTVAPQTVNEDTATGSLAVTVGDVETAAGLLTLVASSSNTALVPVANITLGGSGAARTVAVTPVANQNGIATVTLTVTDGSGATAFSTFLVTVDAVNDAPTISTIPDQVIVQDSATDPLAFTIGDAETAANALVVTAISSDVTVVTPTGITLGGTAANRTITVTPVSGKSGTATMTVTVSDGSLSSNSVFTIRAVSPNEIIKKEEAKCGNGVGAMLALFGLFGLTGLFRRSRR